MTRRNRYKESRKQLKDRLIREGRWEEFMKVRENLKAAGVPQGEAWVQASLQFEPGAAGAVPPMPRDNPREIPASPPSPPAIPAASPGPANEAAVAISQAHIAAGHPSPVQNPQVRELLNGIKRSKGTAPAKKTALLMKDIRTMVSQLPGNLLGIRDRAFCSWASPVLSGVRNSPPWTWKT